MERIAAPTGARENLTPPPDPRPVGIVGFGLLGEALARRLLASGHPVQAFDPSPTARGRMAPLGVAAAADAAALAASSGCVLLVVYDAAQAATTLRALADGAQCAERLPVLCATTLAPDEACALAREYSAGPLAFVELPVSGSSHQVLDGNALALVGSDADLAPGVQAIVEVLCPRHLRVGGDGAAARLKLVINLVLEINRAGLAEGLALAQAFGLDLALVERALPQSAAASRVMALQARKMRTHDFEPAGRLAQSLKDMDAMLADGRGRFLPVGSAARELLAGCVRAGEGALDAAAIVRELKRRAGRASQGVPC